MSAIALYDYQLDAVRRMKNGCILCGGVGSGKSRTALAYFYLQNGGDPDALCGGDYIPMEDPPRDLYIITTARKRDTGEWERELSPFLLTATPENRLYRHTVVIDSWNNIGKYREVSGAFFLFDEQRVVGSGAWVKAFLAIAKRNKWILLSATPGDTWLDYVPVFLANGFYPNRTAFTREHVIYGRVTRYPKVEGYRNTGRLMRLRRDILVTMAFARETVAHHQDVETAFDLAAYREVGRSRWNPFTDAPIVNAGELCYVWRRVVNADASRGDAVLDILREHPRAVIFYNFDYELALLKSLAFAAGTKVAEWNGHAHEALPTGDRWAYLVQYTAGCEGWNCVTTDTVVFFSQNYSYKVMTQAAGRIDRLNTPFRDLWYFHLKSRSAIDLAIARALQSKRNFNEGGFVKWN